MSKNIVLLNLAVSIDGYIADKDHKVDWIVGDDSEPKTTLSDMGLDLFISRIETIIMGRKSYEVTKGFGRISKQFPNKEIFVMTHSKIEDPDIKTISGDIKEIIKKAKGDIWLFGGSEIISLFMKDDLIDEMEISIIPSTIGSGIPLFKEINDIKKWVLKSNESYNGIVKLSYKRRKNESR